MIINTLLITTSLIESFYYLLRKSTQSSLDQIPFKNLRQSAISPDCNQEAHNHRASVTDNQVNPESTVFQRVCGFRGIMLICAVLLTTNNPALADQNDDCVADPDNDSIVTCSGDLSAGVSFPDNSTISVLNVNSSTVIKPLEGTQGILLQNAGTAPAPDPDSVLGIPVPGDGSGGVLQVNNHSDITTQGDNAHGLQVESRTTGFPDSVTTALEAFDENNISFVVTTVSGSTDSVGAGIDGVLIGDDGIPVTDDNGVELNAGIFTINTDGSFDFDFGTAFDDLALGELSTTRINYEVEMTSNSGTTGDSIVSEGFLYVTVTRVQTLDADGNPEVDSEGDPVTELVIDRDIDVDPDTGERTEGPARIDALFADFGGSTKPTDEGEQTVFPDLVGYAERLLADAREGGAGNSVNVISEGVVETAGVESHGIFAKSQGANGGDGRNANSTFLCIASTSSRPGGTGKRGGNVTVTANGSISTTEAQSTGVTAISRAGNGGSGGDGTICRYGSDGGTGGNGGNVDISGSVEVHTIKEFASGVLAFSEGGNGGDAGDGSWWNGAGGGGSGGQGGSVVVDGSWSITTEGDKAHGIWAKSLGGNAGAGGSGGWLGGSPGGGGLATDGGSVSVISNGSIETSGIDAFGIYAQSVGGFGGKGGDAFGIFYSSGGDGNSAGSGGEVNVTNTINGTIITHGLRAHAIYAQSIGGGGGSGGGAGAIVSVGGTGAAGGNGGNVTVANNGEILTEGVNARGIYAQSIGGGGGDGGDTGGLVAIGGSASGTSDGGVVTVSNNGSITTQGIRSNAIFAESVGGGGGDGGSSGGWFSIGGSGGGGGNADNVTVDNFGLLRTAKADSSAIFAQSVGGGGGNGGGSVSVGAFVSVAIGGDGGAGGDAGEVVSVTNAGVINTAGERSHGIHAQSVGGGGGNGGYAISVAIGKGGSLAVALGGDGAAAGDGKTVTVNSSESIKTQGKDAHGIFAQSVGGGGGSGGFSIAASVSDGVSGSLSMGGDGGAGGDSGEVNVNSTGDIQTGIMDSDSMSIDELDRVDSSVIDLLRDNGFQTIAELAVAEEGDLSSIDGLGELINTNTLLDQAKLQMQKGDHAYGILAQSVGGGGGDGGFSIAGAMATGGAAAFSMGGGGGAGGNGNNVNVYSESNITTYGKDAHAIVAQSVGGGGGSGGFSIAGSIGGSIGAAASLGGSGGDGSVGRNVFIGEKVVDEAPLYITGNINTAGDHAFGILAQSIGGGGGDGGFSVAGTLAKSGAASFSMGGGGGTGGHAGMVEVYSGSQIRTLGKDAHGIMAQSVGGGGGTGGFSVAGSLSGGVGGAASLGGSGGVGGDGGQVTVDNIGDIETGVLDKDLVVVEELKSIDAAVIALLSSNGFETIAQVATASEEELLAIEGIDQATATTVLEQASVFMQQDSHAYGILAQSVGGGGGDGGFSIAGAFTKNGSATFSMGGSGAAGGAGSNVDVLNSGNIVTHGENSYGVLAQSTGGGGGSGGFSIAASISLGKSAKGLNVSLGGSGGSGGNGGQVDVNNDGFVVTEGRKSHGIYALSLGGGGGIGGFSATGSLSPNTAAKQLGVSIGGFGGAGGDADQVTVSNNGTIVTSGERANAIYAQSIGGGGGDGGLSFSGSFSGQEAKQMSVSVGGFGGGGGNGDGVDVNNSGLVETFNQFSNGIFAQSIGGGGGNGGMSVSTAFGVAGRKADYNLSLSLGGFGGEGGTGGNVTVNNCVLDTEENCLKGIDNSINIITHGADSYGIYAQSIGGGGGDGGSSFAGTIGIDTEQDGKSNNLAVAVGGFGGAGNRAGAVEVNNNGVIDTSGNESHAIYGQSIGGGGGNGGSARTLSLVLGLTDEEKAALESDEDANKEKNDKSNKSLEVAVGGTGGEGGEGGTVSITNDGKIVTRGADAHGIFAQSIGGGGGTGGNGAHGVPDELPIPEVIDEKLREQLDDRNKLEFKEKLDIVVGGNGGFGNDADKVTIKQTGDIATLNNGSYGILAQSIGAGGGVGGNGAIGKEGKVGIGGGGGAAGDGGEVDIAMDGNIDTVGVSAHGIFAQSIGGGGGIAGNLDFGVVDVQEDVIDLPVNVDSKINNIGIGIGWGRDGGSAGHGGKVTILSDGDITTRGDAAYGIFAQSVGGGGGLAGNNGFGLAGEILNKASCIFECNALAGSAGGDGSGGEIDITHTGNITTFGDVSHGIFAQSAGGMSHPVTGDKYTTLAGDPQLLDENGDPLSSIFNTDSVTGLLLPDIGDLGLNDVISSISDQMRTDYQGFIDNYLQASTADSVDLEDYGKDVRISVTGNVVAHGANSHGIFAQSVGGDGNGNIAINILGGTVQGGTESGAAIRFKDGADNTLDNEGTLMSVNGVFGNAVIGGDGNETINNQGTVTGIVNLGAGSNTFNNNADARLNAGSTIALGNGASTGTLTNHGTLSPGDVGQPMTTTVTGDLVQTDSGRYVVDLDMSDYRIDLLDISGTGSFGGSAELGLIHPEQIQPGTHRMPIASAAAGITDEGVTLKFQPSAVSEYQLVFDENNEDLLVEVSTDFAPSKSGRMSANQKAIGRHINDIQKAGGSDGFAPVVSVLVNQPDEASLAATYDHLSPGPLLSIESVNVNASLRFNEAMLSCRQRDDPHRYVREGECDWLQVLGRTLDRDSSATASGFHEKAFEISGGAQRKINEKWHRGWALSYERSNLDLDGDLGESVGDRFQAGAMLKGNFGTTTFSSGLTLGYGSYETDRNTGLPAPNTIANSSQTLSSLALHLRFARVWTSGNRYIRPMIDGGLSFIHYSSFNETGAGGANLNVRSHNETYPSLQPALEIGGEFKRDSGTLLRPYIKLGVTHFFDGTVPEITASFEGAPQQVAPFTVQGETNKTFGDVTLGLDILKTNNSVLRLHYNGQFSGDVRGHAVAVKYSWPF